MGGIIRRILKFRYRGVLLILLLFTMISVILFVELSGVQTTSVRNHLELLPSESIVTKAEASASLDEKALLLRNGGENASNLAYQQFTYILGDMKVGYRDVDLSV